MDTAINGVTEGDAGNAGVNVGDGAVVGAGAVGVTSGEAMVALGKGLIPCGGVASGLTGRVRVGAANSLGAAVGKGLVPRVGVTVGVDKPVGTGSSSTEHAESARPRTRIGNTRR